MRQCIKRLLRAAQEKRLLRAARGTSDPERQRAAEMEDVVPSRKRGSEEVGLPDDPNLTPADESPMGISEMAVILMSLGVAPANFTVAGLFCRNRFGESPVDMGFGRALVVDCATGWSMSGEERMEEIEQHIRDEEPVLLIGSPMCRAFSTLIELTQAGKPSEVELKNLVERCVTHLKFYFRMHETQRNAGRLFLHEHPWMRGLVASVSLTKMAEKDGVHKTEGDLCRFQLATNSIEKGSWFMSNSECISRSYASVATKGGQAKNHVKNFVVAVSKGLKRELDSVKALGSMEVGVTCEEPNVIELDEYAE